VSFLQTYAKQITFALMTATRLFIAVFMVLACVFAFRMCQLAGAARQELGSLTSQVSTTLAQVNATEKDASAKFGEEQRQFGELVVASKHIVQRTDQELFGRDLKSGLFGQARHILANSNQFVLDSDTTIKAQNSSMLETQAQLRATLFNFSRDSSATLAQSKNLLDQLNQDAADPAIHSSLEQIQLVTTNVAGTSKDLKDVADKFRNDYLKPQKFAWELLKSLAGMGGSVSQMVK
jgi:hypothetical protein